MQNGKLRQWKKDFGFIEIANGERYFVHISTLKRGGIHQPRIGDTIFFTVGKDKQGRSRAQMAASSAEQLAKNQARREAKAVEAKASRFDWVDYLAMGLLPITLLLLVWSPLRWVLLSLFVVMSAASFALYALDKKQAARGAWRIPEAVLHFIATLGGWPGAWAAQQVYRHKTQKGIFRVMFCLSMLINLVGLSEIMISSVAHWF
ncbi:DUF1294 domain-containing protein [Deefgea piscis]|uniref:DUF1294 domain-containing protein n=1 Tax=Deefgea piscis TaxID=2739061 RepID=A0A6M8SVB7_9NEIS|nr:DUF1294 domain-containing protein [Deefgea piscis]QKJ67240.1 DUF1294 domain-containing protein [Deefgea piscis]